MICITCPACYRPTGRANRAIASVADRGAPAAQALDDSLKGRDDMRKGRNDLKRYGVHVPGWVYSAEFWARNEREARQLAREYLGGVSRLPPGTAVWRE